MADIGLPDEVTRGALLLVAGDAQAGLAPSLDVLRGKGYRVAVVASLAAALSRAALAPRPALILFDAAVPEMEAREAVAALRRDPATRDIPVIFLIPAADAGAEERAFRDGAADCVARPVRPEVLLARVRSQLLAGMSLRLLRGRAVKPAAPAGDDPLPATAAGDDALRFADALEIITSGCGRQFDPAVTRAFLAAFDEFVEVAARTAEPNR